MISFIVIIKFFYSYFLIGYYALGNSGRAIVDTSIVISQIGTCNSVIFCFIENRNPFMFLSHCVIHGQLSICNAHNFSKTLNLSYTRAFSRHFARNKFNFRFNFKGSGGVLLVKSKVLWLFSLHCFFKQETLHHTVSPHPLGV